MIIHFGLHLDGMQPAPPLTAAGEAALGPARMLDLLEEQLGLPPVRTRPGEALLAYQSCLEDADSASRFYHRSFQVDPLGVARTLLDWRARWHEAGWPGRFDDAVSRRLADMADVEQLTRERVPLTPGERLQRIARALDVGLVTQIARIVLHDERAALPAAWREVLDRFGCEIAPGIEPRANAPAGTDLHRLQQILLGRSADGGDTEHRGVEHAALAGDSSCIVVRGVSRDLTAQALGEYLRRTNTPDETVVIAERDGIIVDNALERVGLPRAGFQHYSRFRAVTQVLKLGLSLVWKPVSPQLLLQFLLHPVGPLPGRVRAALAEAVAGEPGTGGHAWRAALEAVAERERLKAAGGEPGAPPASSAIPAAAWQQIEADLGEPATSTATSTQPPPAPPSPPSEDAASVATQTHSSISAEASRRMARLLDDVRYWLECERYSPADGAPVTVLIARTQRCATWLTRRLHGVEGSEADLYAAAEAQCAALIDALGKLAARGTSHVPRLVLERLVDEVTGHSADPSTFAHAGHVRATTAPGTLTAPWRTVIWWDLAPQWSRVGYPWSDAELEELAAQGVELPPADELIRMRNREWMRPILNARSQLILVVHDREEGHHPLWSRLTSIARGFNEVRVEEQLLGDGGLDVVPAIDVATEPLDRRPLPARRRWWRLPPGARIPRRRVESYSSLQKLAYYPHEWVLRYAARLSPGRAANLATGPLLYGKLAHRLFESYFERWADGAIGDFSLHDEPAVRAWLSSTLPTIVEQEGAVLDEPGMGVTRERVLATLEDALLSLLRHLRHADIVRVAAEQWHEVPFAGSVESGAGSGAGIGTGGGGAENGENGAGGDAGNNAALCGAIDLLLTDRHGREIVLDVKWGSQEWRGREIAENRALQLATYAYMRKAASEAGRWPEQAYFIVTTGNVIAADTSVFPDAVPFPPTELESIERVWSRLGKAYAWRRAQLADGHIEVNVAGTEPDEHSTAPEDALATAEADPDGFDDFTHLTGWERGE